MQGEDCRMERGHTPSGSGLGDPYETIPNSGILTNAKLDQYLFSRMQ